MLMHAIWEPEVTKEVLKKTLIVHVEDLGLVSSTHIVAGMLFDNQECHRSLNLHLFGDEKLD